MKYGAECWAVRKKEVLGGQEKDYRIAVGCNLTAGKRRCCRVSYKTRQISFSGNDDVLTDTTCKTRKDHVIKRMPNVNITGTETEKIKLVWIHQEKRKRQPLKKMMDMVVPGKRRRGRSRRRWLDNTRKI